MLRLACGDLTPTRGRIIAPQRVVYCPQRTDDAPTELSAFVAAADRLACVLRGQLGVLPEWTERWEALSHGERKRAQIAVALWHQPRLLAIDEPTNHIDVCAREQLAAALSAFRGVGLLVSHDRALLDRLCRQCLMVDPPGATMRPGGYTQATELAQADLQRRLDERERARRELARLKREQAKRRQEAAGAHRKRSKRGLAAKDHDARARIDEARVTGKDGKAGQLLNQLQGRVQQAADRLAQRDVPTQRRMGVQLTGQAARRDFLYRAAATRLPLGETTCVLELPELAITPADRIAVVGPNGCGKSTLIRHIRLALPLAAERVVYLAQEVDRAEADAVLRELHSLPKSAYGEVVSTISRLGSDPQRVMETELPSPGEVRKILLALGMLRSPQLVILDEPTNHLDLPSIECLEAALEPVGCALLLVSHDLPFLRRLCRTWWRIRGVTSAGGKVAGLPAGD